MKKNLNITSVVAILALASCQKDVQQPILENAQATISSAARPTSTTGNGTVYLNVAVDDLSGISSDGGGVYSHGVSRVEAQILSSDGNFYMQTNSTSRDPIRKLRFPFNAERLEGKANYRLRTTCSEWLQNMDDGEIQIMRFRVWGNQQKGVLDWNMVFDNGLDAQTDYANVTRVNRTTWTIEPANLSPIPATAKLTDGTGAPIGSGYPQVPFRLTLTAK